MKGPETGTGMATSTKLDRSLMFVDTLCATSYLDAILTTSGIINRVRPREISEHQTVDKVKLTCAITYSQAQITVEESKILLLRKSPRQRDCFPRLIQRGTQVMQFFVIAGRQAMQSEMDCFVSHIALMGNLFGSWCRITAPTRF